MRWSFGRRGTTSSARRVSRVARLLGSSVACSVQLERDPRLELRQAYLQDLAAAVSRFVPTIVVRAVSAPTSCARARAPSWEEIVVEAHHPGGAYARTISARRCRSISR